MMTAPAQTEGKPMPDLPPIMWMLIAGAAFAWFMTRGIGPARRLTGVEERGREVLLTFATGQTRSLPRGREGRMWLTDDLRRRLAERTAA